MESSFRSTVLQRPPDDDDDRDRHHRRDHLGSSSSSSVVAPPSGVSGQGPPPPPAPRHSGFSLRSPTQSEFRHPPAYSSPSGTANAHHSPRPVLGTFMSPSPAAAPPTSLPTPLATTTANTSNTSSNHHAQAAPASPLRGSPAYAYPPQKEMHSSREKSAAGSFYDPTTDTTKDRSTSESNSWNAPRASTPKQSSHEPFNYSASSTDQQHSYYNGAYASPGRSSFRARSPASHPPPLAASASPSTRPIALGSPTRPVRSVSPAVRTVLSTGGLPSLLRPASPTPPSTLKAPATSSRAAGVMSFSNILTSSDSVSRLPKTHDPEPESDRTMSPRPDTLREPPLKRKATRAEVVRDEDESTDQAMDDDTIAKTEPDVEPDLELVPLREKKSERDRSKDKRKEKAVVRKPKPRHSGVKNEEATPKSSRRASGVGNREPTPRVPAKRQVNGQAKTLAGISAAKEKRVLEEVERLDARSANFDDDMPWLAEERAKFDAHSAKRRKLAEELDIAANRLRRVDGVSDLATRLTAHSDGGKARYDSIYYDEALQDVRERELFAEKERKKDMQRKRRREKSMAVTIEQKEAALAKARAAEDETERQKHLRDAERASKKAQQTKLILQSGIKGPVRNLADLNLEGGTMATFQASDMEPGKKSKARGGSRPKKSKEQKQAEKDSAEAAQAALDAGEALPSKEDTKIRIKLTKSKSKPDDASKDGKEKENDKDKSKDKSKDRKDKSKDKDKSRSKGKDKDKDKDKENVEPKSSKSAKEKEAVEEIPAAEAKFQSKGFNQIYDQIWRDMARKDVNKAYKVASDSYATRASNLKKTAILASKEAKRWQLRTNKGTKDQQARAKRVMRDMMTFWKRNEREERDLRKAAEKQELENQRKEEADREAARQKRKLNFLISQTELYSHFIGKKIKTNEVERSTDNPEVTGGADKDKIEENQLDIDEPTHVGAKVTRFENLDFDNEDETQLRAAAMANAQNAIAEAQKKAREFNNENLDMDEEGELNFQNPTGLGDVEIEQPALLNAQLKEYQLKGLNWLVNLYEQGINGILADEMGLGKTIQSISVMAYLAQKHDIWGPFLVVAPASTLHNWEQEIRKFVPEFKILPYWGSAGDRKVLRKFWDRKHSTYKKEASFHVCITSYQLVVSDVAYFQKMKWQYMILDEAQAIKSSQSSRWKCLLGFHCRNRLLLTGTPIQNSMQELWALLHFIMPSLFDSHEEFSEWFSKDIESHAQSQTKLNEDQLKRLHMILKPFMLRRVKKHVQKELGDKIEKDVFCNLTYRQRAYYSNLRNQISIMDLIEKATLGDDNDSGTLMNLVMQFRKVCNHPDLFERADTSSPLALAYFAETASFIREGNDVTVGYSTRSRIEYELPRLVWRGGARLDKAGADNSTAGWRNKYLHHMMNIFTPNHVRDRLEGRDGFSFLRFADTSVGELYEATHEGIMERSRRLAEARYKDERLARMRITYDDEEGFTPAHALFRVVARNDRKPLAEITTEGILGSLMNVARSHYVDSGLGRLEQAGRPRASAPPIDVVCSSRGTALERESLLFNVPYRRILYGPTAVERQALITQKVPPVLYPPAAMLPAPDNEKRRWTNVAVPSMRRFVTDSGKLAELDELLFKLKNEGHRVLLYFQMTRMIDLMEEYLTYRNYKYCRLDGSTKLEDRRDTVHDFQTHPEIFIFLLSTRAGGLGINLTSADTVIFYDSDWNPTIDSQAMDRAHRLGQTKQVTVYRLITRGTIEERIRKRALQKEEVQRVVIQGGGASVDFSGRRAPENRNRDIAMWLADDEQAQMIEQREKELLESGEYDKVQKKRGGKRKRVNDAGGNVSLDDMYHEGEGHFDDNNKPSGTATPVGDSDAKGVAKKRKTGSKKAKTAKQRLAIADGEMDM